MAAVIYGFNALTGGTEGCLDAIDGGILADGDMAVGISAGVYHSYSLDADSGADESSPTVISPDANAGDKRWILASGTSSASLDTSNLMHIQDRKTSGTAGGTFTGGAWQTRTLNTILTANISGASLSSNAVTLPAGTYWVEGYAMAHRCNMHKTRVYQTSGTASTLVEGSSEICSASMGGIQTKSCFSGLFTLAAQQTIELQHQCSMTEATDGFGYASGFSTEVYADIKIWKVG